MPGQFCDNFIMTEDGENFEMTQTTKGDPGEGVPTGGTAGQVLKKVSGDDYDTEWADLDAGDVGFDSTETYQSGTVGAELSDLSRQLSDLTDTVSTTQIINTASGDIASFDDGADEQPIRELVAQIEPVQDLHGYDNPWPAGGGKNLYPILCSETTYESGGITFRRNANGTITVSGTATTRVDLDVLLFTYGTGINEFSLPSGTYTISVSGITISGIEYIAGGASNTSGLEYFSINASANNTKTITINEGTTGYNLLRIGSGTVITSPITVAIQWESGSTATTYSPYSNICPISGWTGAEIKQTGKNLIPNLKVQDTSIRVRLGESTVGNGFFLKAGTYKISWGLSETQTIGIYWRTYKDGVEGSIVNSNLITLSEDCNVRIWLYASAGISVDNVAWWQVELGSTATDYEPYTANQISVTFPSSAGTVYGGTLDVISGVLTVDRAYTLWVGATSETYLRDSGEYGYRFRRAYADADQTSGRKQVLCNMGIFSSGSSVGTTFLAIGYIFYYPPSTITTIDEFKTWLSTNNLQFVYPLNTPIEYQLTPQQLDTLLGTNNIWADTGDTEVTYPTDTKLYIDGKIADAIAALNA